MEEVFFVVLFDFVVLVFDVFVDLAELEIDKLLDVATVEVEMKLTELVVELGLEIKVSMLVELKAEVELTKVAVDEVNIDDVDVERIEVTKTWTEINVELKFAEVNAGLKEVELKFIVVVAIIVGLIVKLESLDVAGAVN